jgi:hypothetical protein
MTPRWGKNWGKNRAKVGRAAYDQAMRTTAGFVLGLILGIGFPASAGETIYHPQGTVPPNVFLPAECTTVYKLNAEQWRPTTAGEDVREVVVRRLRCSSGVRWRMWINRGPWIAR